MIADMPATKNRMISLIPFPGRVIAPLGALKGDLPRKFGSAASLSGNLYSAGRDSFRLDLHRVPVTLFYC